ncbi:ribosome biogenesis GTP-binding protein YihA/YsxC [Candidatus Anaplasma sp. TIGMIC]|uniref:ribosome biogenesis GTP-binding protein YihA/YsxC n=1 Tax=Candidatus Anaplasma sp. TIGMIC TaxID=3020713 RepID=UPI00232C65A9|nr:ribosome biogenesis GTP-binding protein YihA/YsxC [Candidatus Anaplasma sp. TIGMIC]MDB1135711.1 ribosome biogenesis GTP-binding protein YihA/YsxC [Candidatus Anaplasma sp. TIGMIC]
MLSGCKFFAGVRDIGQFPDLNLPEIAFAGRSNVGKSSLINAITHNRNNAKVSSNPGSTRQINLYVGTKVVLVDLPGYGYSKASKQEVDRYLGVMEHYLMSREALQRLVLLIDSRIGLKDIDRDFLNWLEEYNIHYSVVLTKADKLSATGLNGMVSFVWDQVKGGRFLLNPIMWVSSKSGKGIKELAHEVSRCI